MDKDDCKPWTDEHQHILGVVKRSSGGIRQLLLYRHAVDLDHEPVEEVDVMAVVEGQVFDVRCSICGCIRTWYPGQEALEHLLRQVQRNRSAIR